MSRPIVVKCRFAFKRPCSLLLSFLFVVVRAAADLAAFASELSGQGLSSCSSPPSIIAVSFFVCSLDELFAALYSCLDMMPSDLVAIMQAYVGTAGISFFVVS